MGTIDDALVLAKYAVVVRTANLETELLHHRQYLIRSQTSRFLSLIRQRAGTAPLAAVQRADLSPFELPNEPLPGARMDPQQPLSSVMGTCRPAVNLSQGTWKTGMAATNGKTRELIVPPPPPALAKEAAKGVPLDVVKAYDTELDTVPYTYVLRSDRSRVSKSHGVIVARPKVLRDGIYRARALLALEELKKGWPAVRRKPWAVQVDIALAGVFPVSVSPNAANNASTRVFGDAVYAPKFLVRALGVEGRILTFRIGYHQESLFWWDADAEE